MRDIRNKSSRATTRELAKTPGLFGELRQPERSYLAIPKTSSASRNYVPIAFIRPEIIANTELFTISEASIFDFGVLTSRMHMAWVRHVAGRLKSDIRYSAGIVYNNFPWPQDVSPEHRKRIEEIAARVIAERIKAGDGRHGFLPGRDRARTSTLADIYDPLFTPRDLLQAHIELDRAVDRRYRREPFHSDRERVEHLFRLYEQLTAPLLPATPKTRTRRSPTAASTPRERRSRTPGLPEAGA